MRKISVIVPVYNVEKYLNRCIESIINQTYTNLEIILVNDGSNDASGNICEKYKIMDNRVVVIHKDNGGISSARNAGIDISKGEFICFVDGDDWLSLNAFEHLLSIFHTHGGDVLTGGLFRTKKYIEEENDNVAIEVYNGKDILNDYLYRGTIRSGEYSVCRNMYKSDLFENIRFPLGQINEDIVTNYKIFSKVKKRVISSKITYYYFQDSLSTTRGKLSKKNFNLLDVSEELLEITKHEDYKNIRYYANVKKARSYFSLLAKGAKYGFDESLDKKETIKFLTMNLRKNKLMLQSAPIPRSRKILVRMFCINYYITKSIITLLDVIGDIK